MRKIASLIIILGGIVEAVTCDYRSLNERADIFCEKIINDTPIRKTTVANSLWFVRNVDDTTLQSSATWERISQESEASSIPIDISRSFQEFLKITKDIFESSETTIPEKIAISMLFKSVIKKLLDFLTKEKQMDSVRSQWQPLLKP